MAAPPISKKDGFGVLRASFDDATGRLRVDAAINVDANEISISAADGDNVAISDGVDTLAINPDGSLNANVTGTLDIEVSAADGDNIAISDGVNTLEVNPDGSINSVVTATNLDIRDLTFATDKVDISGSTLGSNSGVDIGDVTINNGSGISAVNIQDGGNSITVDGSVTVSATNLDIRDLTFATDKVDVTGSNVTVTATDLDIRNLNATQDNVAISDGVDTLQINSDGSLNVVNSPVKLFLTGSGSALNALVIPSTDVSSYDQISVQLLGTFVATVTWEASNDNTNWSAVLSQVLNNAATTPATTANAVGLYKIPIAFRFFRVRISAFTSGTVSANLSITAIDSMDFGQRQTSATQSGAWLFGNVNAQVTGTGAALNATPIALNAVPQYDVAVVALTGTWVATVVAEATNDGTNFFTIPVQRIDSLTSLPQINITTNGLYRIPLDFNQVRLRISSYTSGTVAANARISASNAENLGPILSSEYGTTVNTFNEVSGVASGVLTTVLSYTPAVSGTLQFAQASGDNYAEYYVYVNGVLVAKNRSYYTNFNSSFDFKRGIAFNAGNIILVRVLHSSASLGTFNASIQTAENS